MSEYKKYKGLTQAEVEESRAKYGCNVLTPPEKESLWKKFLEKFDDPIIKILLAAWVLSMAISAVHCWGPDQAGVQAFFEPLGIFFAILLASTIGFVFEVKAAKAFEVLNTVNDDVQVTVERDGRIQQVSRKDIVVGDIVLLGTGDEIPADGVLVESASLQVNESTLTGEPVVTKTTVEADFDSDATYPSNRVLRGTTVVDGHAIMCVELVGDATENGKVNRGAQIESDVETPLQMQLKKLADVISKFGYAAAAVSFLLLSSKLFFADEPLTAMGVVSAMLNNFMIAVTLIVVSVPEGLPMSVTLSLALSMNRMLKANNLVRKMHACETMGATTVICTDKTGTLTQNMMQVHEVNFFTLKGGALADDEASQLIAEGIAANSTANLDKAGGVTKTIGNPTEAALLLWLDKAGVDYAALRDAADVVSRLTFSTERKYMATVVTSPSQGKRVLYVKGAPEIVLALCENVASPDGASKGVEENRAAIENRLAEYQSMAMRTLGFAYQILEEGDNDAPYSDGTLCKDVKLTFAGFVAISDPVRADVPEAVQSCLAAGVDVKIVTGDTPGTAREIARQIGICDASLPADAVITGPDFEVLTDDEAAKRLAGLKVMCRARPMDKQRLVRLLQEQGAVVAVTGDGTNDAPALKAAQVGLSMGDGTSVAKEASDITIIDNSFGSITQAVMWGRSLYKNIQRFLLFQLTINVAACFIVMLGSLVGTSSPLTITQMLWVNLIMDTFAAAALASLPPHKSVMNEKPRKNSDFIITRSMAANIFGYALLFMVVQLALLLHYYNDGVLSPVEMSKFFTIFVMLQFWNMFNAKAYMTKASAFKGLAGSATFLAVALLIAAGQWAIVTFGGTMFSVVPLSASVWCEIVVATSLVLVVPEVVKAFKALYKRFSNKY